MTGPAIQARIALARFAISALSLYIRDLKDAKEPGMSLRQIAEAITDALNENDL